MGRVMGAQLPTLSEPVHGSSKGSSLADKTVIPELFDVRKCRHYSDMRHLKDEDLNMFKETAILIVSEKIAGGTLNIKSK